MGSMVFFAGAGDEVDRAAFKAKGAAHFVGEVFAVNVGKKIFAVDEEDEGGRGLPDLRGVEKFQAMTGRADGLAALDGVVQGAIENRGGNLLLQLRGDVTNGFKGGARGGSRWWRR